MAEMDQFQKTMIESAQKAIETEKIISTTKPYPRPSKDYLTVLTRHQYTKIHTQNGQQQTLKLNQVTAPKHCSIKLIDQLEPIRLKDMLVNHVHQGKYLLCRIVGDPFYLTAISLLVEDEDGQIENVSVYNYTTSYDIDPSDVLPTNSVLMIKEPYLKIMISDNNNFYIRVESPTDIVMVDEHNVQKWKSSQPEMTNEQLNELGNKFFVKKEYRQAIRYYNQALRAEKSAKTYSNRAAAHLELEMFIEAFRDAEESARIEPSEKAFYRMGRAAYAMRQYGQAAESWQKCVQINEKNKKAAEDLKRCEERMREARTGVYDMKRLIKDTQAGILRLDVADFVSSAVMVGDVPNKAKGVVAVEKIKRGSLLVASKAASIAYDSECKVKVISSNFYTKKLDQSSHNQNLANLFFKLQHDPFLAKKVYELYAGPDIDRTQQVPEGIVDSSRAEVILTFNSFITQNQKDFVSASSSGQEMEDNSGLWLFPSFFNHSCVPNTKRLYLKDFVMFYAFRDIEKGEEITTQYTGLSSFDERQKVFVHFGFECKCELCEIDRSDANFAARESILAKNGQIQEKLMTMDENYLLKYVRMVKNTYGPGQKYHYRMSIPLSTLAGFYRIRGDLKKAAETFIEIFNILKECDSSFSGMVIVQAVNCYLQCSMIKEAKVALKMAKEFFVGSVEYHNYVYEVNNFSLS